jgi:hypothetical protein
LAAFSEFSFLRLKTVFLLSSDLLTLHLNSNPMPESADQKVEK